MEDGKGNVRTTTTWTLKETVMSQQLIAFVITPVLVLVGLFLLAIVIGKWFRSKNPYGSWIIYKNERNG
jgi:hypothetical protein